jgi:WS/DGAT/MGAT family acyltransferase
MDRMSALDAEFVYLEDDTVLMHIGACAVFEGPAPAFEDFVAMTTSKLPQVPRFRQIVRGVRFGLGRPVWVDDPHFLADYHLRHTALPGPGDQEQLHRLTSRIMTHRLDRARPLWESWMVEGLDDGRWAVISKVHHSVVDGVSGTEMMSILLDVDPDAPIASVEPWKPGPGPNDLELAVDAVAGFLGQLPRTARALGSVLAHPSRLLDDLRRDRDGLAAAAKRMRGARTLVLGGPVGPHRRWGFAEASLDEIKQVKNALGGTVNDVVLAAISGGFRALLEGRSEPVDGLTLRTFVPVSVRGDDEHGQLNNKVSGLIAELPIGLDDPRERLQFLRAQMDELKASHGAEVGEAATSLGDLVFPGLLALGSRAAMRLMERLPGLSIGTITTNVPGPQVALHCLGRELVGYYPYVPVAHGLPVTVAILSYNGRVAFGVTGDYETVPDLDVLTRGIHASLAELVKAAAETEARPAPA